MLAINYKRAEKVEWTKPLAKFIKANYSDDCLRDATPAIDKLQSVSSETRSIQNAEEVSKELLKKYYASLSLLEGHFPFSDAVIPTALRVEFVWYDGFQSKKRAAYHSVNFEKAGVLFNLAALLSQQATAQNLSTPEGLRTACNDFQGAAGLFTHLKESIVPQIVASTTPDLSIDCLTVLINVMLGQAQACFFEKAVKDNMKAATAAKLAAQAAEFYELAARYLNSPALQAHFEKHVLPSVIKLQLSHFRAQAQYRQSMACKEESKYGEEILRLQIAQATVKEALKGSKGAPANVVDTLNRLSTALNTALAAAVKDNDIIYHDVVPKQAALAPIPKAAIVKPTPVPDLIPAVELGSPSDPWSKLVPISIQKANSEYRETLGKYVRDLNAEADSHTNLLKNTLQSWGLPGTLQGMNPDAPVLPEGLMDAIRAIKRECGESPNVYLAEMLSAIASVSNEDTQLFSSIEKLLQEEEAADEACRRQYGTGWSRPAARQGPARHLLEELSKHRVNLQKAKAADAIVQQKLERNRDLLSSLDRSEADLKRLAPGLQMQAVDMAAVDSLRQLVAQTDQVLAERRAFLDELKLLQQEKQQLPESISPEEAAASALRVVEPLRAKLGQNFATQKTLLQQIEMDNARFQASAPEFVKARKNVVIDFDKGVALFRELQNNFKEGMEFYAAFQDTLEKLKKQSSDFVYARNTQKDDMLRALTGGMANMNIRPPVPERPQPGSPGAGGYGAPQYGAAPTYGTPPPPAYGAPPAAAAGQWQQGAPGQYAYGAPPQQAYSPQGHAPGQPFPAGPPVYNYGQQPYPPQNQPPYGQPYPPR